jgi:hypothetical protein
MPAFTSSPLLVPPNFSPVGRGAAITEVMRMTAAQAAYYLSTRRYNIVPCGRRSGKTAIAKRRLVKLALRWHGLPGARFLACAPTHLQAKAIFWRDLKVLVPKWALLKRPADSDLTIELKNGAIIQVAGLDRPERIEGPPVAHLLIDEFGNVHEDAWGDNLRATLTDTQGTADIIGVPEGRNHYWQMWINALEFVAKEGDGAEWGCHTWKTADVLPMYLGDEKAAREIISAKASMDPLTYAQEFEASFNNFDGRIYYPFTRETHACHRLRYNPNRPLVLCFDFNTSPGTCVYAQEHTLGGIIKQRDGAVADEYTAVIGEVWIPRNSNTPMVCRRIINDWWEGPGGSKPRIAKHQGEVHIYGDPSGGAKTTEAVAGSDYDLIRDILRPVFGENFKKRYARAQPRERIRVNALNTRLLTADGKKRLLVDPINAPRTVEDLEAVVAIKGTAGEIDKDSDPMITHLTEGLGHYVVVKHPMTAMVESSVTAV